MAKIDLKFLDIIEDEDYIHVEKKEYVKRQVIRIGIHDSENDNEYLVDLDKSTAIKFAKTLRTEINKIKEVHNG